MLDLGFDEIIRDVALQANGRIVLTGRTEQQRRHVHRAPHRRTAADGLDHLAHDRDRTTSTTPFLALAGTAADGSGVASVTWVTDRGFSGTATGTTAWAADVPLPAAPTA